MADRLTEAQRARKLFVEGLKSGALRLDVVYTLLRDLDVRAEEAERERDELRERVSELEAELELLRAELAGARENERETYRAHAEEVRALHDRLVELEP